jgi:hypothetical protein
MISLQRVPPPTTIEIAVKKLALFDGATSLRRCFRQKLYWLNRSRSETLFQRLFRRNISRTASLVCY